VTKDLVGSPVDRRENPCVVFNPAILSGEPFVLSVVEYHDDARGAFKRFPPVSGQSPRSRVDASLADTSRTAVPLVLLTPPRPDTGLLPVV
jgi:hypothetical protein